MPATRLLTVFIRTWARAALPVIGAACAALVLAPATAGAFTADVEFPASVSVGQAGLTATLTLTNTNALPATVCNMGECDSQGIILVTACTVPDPPGTCKTPDLGVFAVAASATVTLGSCGANPLVTGFSVADAGLAEGSVRLTPIGGSWCSARRRRPPPPASSRCRSPAQAAGDGRRHRGAGPADAPVGRRPRPARRSGAVRERRRPRFDDGAPARPDAAAAARAAAAGTAATARGPGRARSLQVLRGVAAELPPPARRPARPVRPAALARAAHAPALQPGLQEPGQGPAAARAPHVLRDARHGQADSPAHGRRDEPVRAAQADRPAAHPPVRAVAQAPDAGAVPTTPNPARLVDHFRCYDVQAQPASRTVTLRDQFKTTTAKVVRVVRLCNPVRKNNEPVRRAKAHLVCYSITEAAFQPLAVRVRNQFGRAALRIRRPETLCLPSFKEVVQTAAPAAAPPGLDHFKCYEAEQPQFQPRFVGLRDQFGQSEGQVIATRQICNPVRKNNGRVLNPRGASRLLRDAVGRDVPFQPREVRVLNQFGIRQLSVVKPVTLCVPSLKRKGAGAAPTGAEPDARPRPLPLLRRQAAGGGARREARRPVQDDEDEGPADRAPVQPGTQEQRGGAAAAGPPRLLLDQRGAVHAARRHGAQPVRVAPSGSCGRRCCACRRSRSS